MIRRLFIAFVGAAVSTACVAQEIKPVRLGVLNDQSGVYADFGGRGSVLAARMAVEDYGGGGPSPAPPGGRPGPPHQTKSPPPPSRRRGRTGHAEGGVGPPAT